MDVAEGPVDHEPTAYQYLAAGILRLAIWDAVAVNVSAPVREDARAFLDSVAFDYWCHAAGLRADLVRRRVRACIDRAEGVAKAHRVAGP